jgi:hypothetical protein
LTGVIATVSLAALPHAASSAGPHHQARHSDDPAAFVVQDGNYHSARWPGDASLFA